MLTKVARHTSSWFAITLLILLMFTLAACGTNVGNNGSTTTGSVPSGSTPAPSPTATHGLANTSTGCPNSATITTQPAAASVVLKNSGVNNTTTVKKGDTVEVDLPFGHNWAGPTNNPQGLLAMQDPSGYASPVDKVCVWRFVATNTGTTEISFTGRPICEKGQLCPAYIMAVSFTIEVQ
ncbi:MAG: hypothetical protein ABI234_14510 [Ktedonobacteraceae bacterium]